MKVLIDANVLYPTVMRQVVLGVAGAGLFAPLWTARILEEWALAAARHGDAEIARVDIALLRDRFRDAEVEAGDVSGLSLPDPDDVHVLAAAIAAGADAILTQNARDFPRRALAAHGLARFAPDPFLRGLWGEAPEQVEAVVAEIVATARALSGTPWDARRLLKKARLPGLGKAVAGAGAGAGPGGLTRG